MKLLRSFALSLVCLFSWTAHGHDLGDVAFRQSLLDLETDLRLLCVAAHPDDEDGATLAYYRMLHGVESHAVIATRGEGGQNELGPELYNELGVIRTREMRAAAAIEGATLHFLDLPEFGYSKNAEETFEVWGKEVALERLVRVIREVRPHVIISNHGRMNDHGHHQAIGAALQEAYSVAADPARFPEHAREGLEAWQPQRLYVRDFRGGEGAIATDIATLEPLRGQTIAEIAASALEVHESQGMKFFIDLLLSTQPKTYYHLIKNEAKQNSVPAITDRGPLFQGLTWAHSPDRPTLDTMNVDRATAGATLLTWLAAHQAFREGSFDEQRRWAAANRAAQVALELRLNATVNDAVVTPQQPLKVTMKLHDFGSRDAIQAEVSLDQVHGLGALGKNRMDIPLHKTGSATHEFAITVPIEAIQTLPLAPRLFSGDFLLPQLAVNVQVNCGDATLSMTVPVYIDIAAPLSIACPDAPYLLQPAMAGQARTLRLLVTNNTPEALSEYLSLTVPEGWTFSPERLSVSFAREDEQRYVNFSITPPASMPPGDYPIAAHVYGAAKTETVVLRSVDIEIPSERRVGVIESYDTTFVTTLEKLGIPHQKIESKDYVPELLDSFTTIIVDIRAYQYRPDLVANNSVLLDYVTRGGTVLVMYQKTFDWQPEFAPFPITVSRNRVTREDAPIRLLVPDHPLFTFPNQITNDDWAGWIQERGLYFPDVWNEAYTPLLETHDPGEEIPPGALLVADVGEGHYLYTALGWYRQLRELHPGALRCFANMLAY